MNQITEREALLVPVERLTRDMMKALRSDGIGVGGITDSEARFLVDLFYTMQRQRIRINNQVKALERDAKKAGNAPEPHAAIDWALTQSRILEEQVGRMLAVYTARHKMSWFFDQTLGIGPILGAGLLAHIDIHKAQTAGQLWRFAGLDPTTRKEKGKRRNYNGSLKTLCWKIGESFVKVSGKEEAFYGAIYAERKQYEWNRNLAGELAAQAANELASKSFGADTDAKAWYSGQCSAEKARAALEADKPPTAADCRVESGGTPMLPPAHIHARAKRYAEKLFLAHLHQRWREEEGLPVPPPYVIAHQGHAHFIAPPQVRGKPRTRRESRAASEP